MESSTTIMFRLLPGIRGHGSEKRDLRLTLELRVGTGQNVCLHSLLTAHSISRLQKAPVPHLDLQHQFFCFCHLRWSFKYLKSTKHEKQLKFDS